MIVIDFATLEFSENNRLTGEVYIEAENMHFPHRHWNDFVAVISGWWISSFQDLITSNSIDKIELLFMDGPFQFTVEKSYKSWVFYFRKGDVLEKAITYNEPIKFLRGFLKQVNGLLKICKENDWDNDDIQKLNKRYRTLKELLKSQNHYFLKGNNVSDTAHKP
jgi:hypothetical protein